MKYTVDYFINKFKKIPANKWFAGNFVNPRNKSQKCAFGHCGETNTTSAPQSKALLKLSHDSELIFSHINDGISTQFKGRNPKERILKALKYIKSKQSKEK